MEAAAAILDFAIGQQLFRRLISRVENYVPSKFCPNRMNGICLPSRNVIFEPLAAILNLKRVNNWHVNLKLPQKVIELSGAMGAKNEIKKVNFFRNFVSRVNLYVHAKFCPNRMSGIEMLIWNVICKVKFGRFWTFDQRPSFWILKKIKKSSIGLFWWSSSTAMPTFV